MDYNKVVELDNVTLEECMRLYTSSNMTSIINDGKIINFQTED